MQLDEAFNQPRQPYKWLSDPAGLFGRNRFESRQFDRRTNWFAFHGDLSCVQFSRSQPFCEFRLCFAQYLQHRLAVRGCQARVCRAVVLPSENLFKTLPEIILHFEWESFEGIRIDQKAAGVAEQPRFQIKLSQ